jgi:F-type H+-transporting ATPase subunit b
MAIRRPPFTSSPLATLALAVLLVAASPAVPSWAEDAAVGVADTLDASDNTSEYTYEDAAERTAGGALQDGETVVQDGETVAEEISEAVHGHALSNTTEEAFDVDPAVAAAKKKSGLPQLDPSSYPSQIFWLLVSFVVLYTLMSRVALPRVTEVLDMRQTQRDNNLNRAEHLQEDAAKIRQTLDAAMAAAQAEAQATVTAREQENAKKTAAENARFLEHARNRIASAEQNIAKAKEEALQSLSDISADVAADIVQKISGTAVNKNDAKKIVVKLMQEG